MDWFDIDNYSMNNENYMKYRKGIIEILEKCEITPQERDFIMSMAHKCDKYDMIVDIMFIDVFNDTSKLN